MVPKDFSKKPWPVKFSHFEGEITIPDSIFIHSVVLKIEVKITLFDTDTVNPMVNHLPYDP